jgi:adenosylhomocysteinase
MASDSERKRIAAYFAHLTTRLGPVEGVKCLCVAHMVPNSLDFIPAIDRMIGIGLVLIKPKSAGRPESSVISSTFPSKVLDREWSSDPFTVYQVLEEHHLDKVGLVIADIGAYFAPSLDALQVLCEERITGVMEGTENGAVEYERIRPKTVPVATVARSRLKLPEDYLVGSSVVFSIEATLRDQAQILQTRTACVIGYGRVGSAVADILRNRGISTVVHDHNPIAMAEAAARGFPVYRRIDTALGHASLVVCATGDASTPALDSFALNSLKPGCVVASVTSSDTVIDEQALSLGFKQPTAISQHLTRYESQGGESYFWLIAGGNAANFIHGAVIGPAIQLIEGEKLAALHTLASGSLADSRGQGLVEVSLKHKELVAQIWNEHFLDD